VLRYPLFKLPCHHSSHLPIPPGHPLNKDSDKVAFTRDVLENAREWFLHRRVGAMKVLCLDSRFHLKEPWHLMGFSPHVMDSLWPVILRFVSFWVEVPEEHPQFEVEEVHFYVFIMVGIDAVVMSTFLHEIDKHLKHVENSGLVVRREERMVFGVSSPTNTLEDRCEFFL